MENFMNQIPASEEVGKRKVEAVIHAEEREKMIVAAERALEGLTDEEIDAIFDKVNRQRESQA